QEVRLAQHLEAVADADDGSAGARVLADRLHHRREAGDRARTEVVTMREAAGHDDRVDALRRRVAVPQQLRRRAERFGCVHDVELAVRAREQHDTDSGRHVIVTSYDSMTGLASNRSHISLTCAAAVSASGASTTRRIVLPMCTCVTLVYP